MVVVTTKVADPKPVAPIVTFAEVGKTVAPPGRPDGVKVTEPLKFCVALTKTLKLPVPFCEIPKVVGLIVVEKSAGAKMLRIAFAVWLIEVTTPLICAEPVPVIVIVYVPGITPCLVVRVKVPEPVAGKLGKLLAVTPKGRPVRLNATGPLNEPDAEVETV